MSRPPRHNHRMRALGREALASFVVFALLTITIAGMCGGWESSPEARMACCAMARHECKGEDADDCCAAGEQRRHGEASSASPSLSPPSLEATVATLGALVPRTWRLLEHSRDSGRPPTVTRLLLCVYLI